jgi:hypothetical protein
MIKFILKPKGIILKKRVYDVLFILEEEATVLVKVVISMYRNLMIVFNSRCVDGGGCLCPRPHGTSQATQLQAGGLTRAIE